MAKSETQLQVSPAAPEYPRLFSDLLVLLKVLCSIGILYFLNAIIFFLNPPATMRITLSPLTKIAAISITVPRTFYAISNFHALSAPLPSLRPLSEFLNIQQLRQRRLRGFQVFDHFYTNYMVICAVWAIYSFFTAKLALLLVTAQTMLLLSTTHQSEPNRILEWLLLPLYVCYLIAPEDFLAAWTMISYIVGHIKIAANPIRGCDCDLVLRYSELRM